MLSWENRAFFAKWLRQPRRIGGVIPSGEPLARVMAAQVDSALSGGVVELGAGTGSVTRALLGAGVDPGDLVVNERDETLYRLLIRRFPGLRILQGDAVHLRDMLAREGVGGVRCIVSSLPLLVMAQGVREAILRQSFELMGAEGVFIQYTYGPVSPVAEEQLRRLGLRGRVAERVWRNVPPATVWRFTSVSAGAA
jgi:phosphatidylethanolamine/phosphatidyl-N-methylethanolamine N-methyltransferase